MKSGIIINVGVRVKILKNVVSAMKVIPESYYKYLQKWQIFNNLYYQ